MQDDGSSPSFMGSRLFRAIAVVIFMAIVISAFVFNPGGGMAQGPLSVRVAVPAEMFDWVEAAAKDFNNSSQDIGGQAIVLSVDSFADSEAALDAASRGFGSANPYAAAIVKQPPQTLGTGVFSVQPQFAAKTVATSYIVGAMRGEYVEPLAKVVGRENLTIADLQLLYDPSSPPDSPVNAVSGGMPVWGAVYSDAYDGPAAAYALASGYQQTAQPNLSATTLAGWLKSFYDASPQGRPSFQLVGEDIAKFGPTGPAAAMLPEATALRTALLLNQKGQSLQLIYPRFAVEQRFDFGIIASGPTDRQREAAAKFRDFLGSSAGRVRAAVFGLRASDRSADTSNGDSLWLRLSQMGAQPAYQPEQVLEPTPSDWKAAAELLDRLRVR